MKNTKAKTVSAGLLVFAVALASLPVAGIADNRPVWSRSRAARLDRLQCQTGAQYRINSEAVRLSLRDPIVKQVQLALRQRGYYQGEISGFIGDETQRAIQLFQVCHCLAAAPLINRCLLSALGIGSEGKAVFMRWHY
jgi:peptidoglycan hydrolase-like protein with peptidoglycan-binding domain